MGMKCYRYTLINLPTCKQGKTWERFTGASSLIPSASVATVPHYAYRKKEEKSLKKRLNVILYSFLRQSVSHSLTPSVNPSISKSLSISISGSDNQ